MSENREFPEDLPLLPMGWGASNLDFDGAKDFWQEVRRITAESSLGDNLDTAMVGKSSPRIWLFLHEPGQGALSAAAALEIARELGSRDQAVLILDCDDTDSKLTRWAGRHEAEGWIDLVRYGASVLTSGVALPFSGRRGYILGVGSFTPTDVEFEEAEDLLNRLKRQADDLVLVAPADATGKLWARLADIRLLCWDRARKSRDLIARVCGDFAEAECPVTGLVSFGLPDEGGQATPVAEEPDTGEEPVVDQGVAADEAVAAGGPEVPASPDDSPPADEPVAEVAPAGKQETGSSRVFWGAALVSLALIAVVSIYYLKFVRTDGTGTPPVAEAGFQLQSQTGDLLGETQPASTGNQVALADRQESAEDSLGTGTDTAAPAATAPATAAPATAAPAAAGPGTDEPDRRETAAPESGRQEFAMDPYLQPVGTDGWALHVYSFPDSASALDEVRRLERKGFQTAIRAVQIKEKGRWYRVYLGSFLSRKEALEAKDPLLKKLRTDWARATEF